MRSTVLIAFAVLALTAAAYWPIHDCGFVSLDDPGYVAEQPMVKNGVHPAAIIWAFTAPHGGNWHPLTSLSHMLDCQIFGLAAGPMHWENLLWHLANVALVFLVWRTFTGALWPSAFVAALFAIHPLHVESVAWIAERKDVLSTFFWMLGLAAYVRYARQPSRGRYLLVLVASVLGLASKPMVVTFPFTLLLLDFWPLQRWPATSFKRLLREKIPFFVLIAALSIVTVSVQSAVGAADFGQRLSLEMRLSNAAVSYVRYLGKTFGPESLAVFYPYPDSWPLSAIIGSLALLFVVTSLVLWQVKRRPWLLFGWLWFLGTLTPVIGLIQVGRQSMADRYTYVPLLGIFTMIAWTGSELAMRWPRSRIALGTGALAAIIACIATTWNQLDVWTSGPRLLQHAVAVTEKNETARLYLADTLFSTGASDDEVIEQCRKVLEFRPNSTAALIQIAQVAAKRKRYDEARSLLEQAMQIDPANASVHNNLGVLCIWQGNRNEALAHFFESVRLRPKAGDTRRELAGVLFALKRYDEARTQLEAAIQNDRWDFDAYDKLGIILSAQGHATEARASFQHALWINPSYEGARRHLAQ